MSLHKVKKEDLYKKIVDFLVKHDDAFDVLLESNELQLVKGKIEVDIKLMSLCWSNKTGQLSKEQHKLLGGSWPISSGWRYSYAGKLIPIGDAKRAFYYKELHHLNYPQALAHLKQVVDRLNTNSLF